MDDCLTGEDTIPAAIELQSQLSNLFTEGSFLLRKWNASEPAVLDNLPSDLKAPNILPLLLFIHAVKIAASQCILRSAPPKWNWFLRLCFLTYFYQYYFLILCIQLFHHYPVEILWQLLKVSTFPSHSM